MLRTLKYTRVATEDAAIPSEKARLMRVALSKRGGSVKIQLDKMPPELLAIKPIVMAVARR